MGAERAYLEVTREIDPRQVALVLVSAIELLCLLRGAAQERGANARPLEQNGNSRAERPGPDDRGTTRMLAGIADGARS
jgi:hypothetical protein